MVKYLIWLWPSLTVLFPKPSLHLSFSHVSLREGQFRTHLPRRDSRRKASGWEELWASHSPGERRPGYNASSFLLLSISLETQEKSWHFPRAWLISGECLRLRKPVMIDILTLSWDDIIFKSNISIVCHVVSQCK